ncbi:MAG: LPS-assembly protein LptD [Candidatus Omnitrophica bacterium]|nr:LPS-assembly protein LptD [Candidatus Omnitrophota bacterium]
MKKNITIILGIIFILILSVNLMVFPQNKAIPVIVDGDEVSYLHQEDKVAAKGNVVIKYKDIVINCNEVVYDVKENIALIKGEVKVSSGKGTVFGENVLYSFNKEEAQVDSIRVESFPLYGEAKKGEYTEDKYTLKNGFVTTCDSKTPHYRLTAKRITIYPGKKTVAKNVFLKIGKVPIFYLPYYSHPIDDKSFPVEIIPGKDGIWGYYTLTRWRYHLNKYNRGKILGDWYENRGIGKGITHYSNFLNFGEALFNVYQLNDKLYRKETVLKYPPYQRYKGQFSYNLQLENFSVVSEFNKFSDEDFMKDFFYREYEIDPHPLSYTLMDWAFYNSSLSLLVQKRVNRFYSETEYLPKLEYNRYKQKIFNEYPFYFESGASLANLSRKNANSGQDDDSLRLNFDNTLSYETKLGWLNINPYAGCLSSYYSKNVYGNENILRNAFKTGVSLSTNSYKVFDGPFSLLGETALKIRHIITPILTYGYIHSPTVSKSQLFQFDNIDDLERKESLIFALDNKFQAKNKLRHWDFLYFSPSLEYKLNEEGKGSYFDKAKMDLEFYPKKEISFNADSTYDCVDRVVKEANADLNFHAKNEKYIVSCGHRYARKESSQGTLGLTYEITPKLQFKNYLRYEYRTGDFKEQQYRLRRDLHCWWVDLGVDLDKEREVTVWIIFRVKAFPKVHIGFDHSYHGAKKSY